MPPNPPFVALIVEDEEYAATRIAGDLIAMGFAQAPIAPTVEAAWDLFIAHPGINLILMDGEVPAGAYPQPPDPPMTSYLIMRIREQGYRGPMIAISTAYQAELLRAGCDQACGKWEASAAAARLFDLPPPRKPGARVS